MDLKWAERKLLLASICVVAKVNCIHQAMMGVTGEPIPFSAGMQDRTVCANEGPRRRAVFIAHASSAGGLMHARVFVSLIFGGAVVACANPPPQFDVSAKVKVEGTAPSIEVRWPKVLDRDFDHYDVFVDDTRVGQTKVAEWTASPVSAWQNVAIRIVAVDQKGQRSLPIATTYRVLDTQAPKFDGGVEWNMEGTAVSWRTPVDDGVLRDLSIMTEGENGEDRRVTVLDVSATAWAVNPGDKLGKLKLVACDSAKNCTSVDFGKRPDHRIQRELLIQTSGLLGMLATSGSSSRVSDIFKSGSAVDADLSSLGVGLVGVSMGSASPGFGSPGFGSPGFGLPGRATVEQRKDAQRGQLRLSVTAPVNMAKKSAARSVRRTLGVFRACVSSPVDVAVTLDVKIDQFGKATAGVSQSSGNSALDACVIRAVGRLAFSKAENHRAFRLLLSFGS